MTTMATGTLVALRRVRQRERAWTRMFCVEAWIEQGGKCAYCREPMKRTDATADHVDPLSLGGPTRRENIKAACDPCNKTKKSMSEAQFMKAIKNPKTGMSIHIWLAWSRRRIWLATERACKRIERSVT